jgi:hypothetical protein
MIGYNEQTKEDFTVADAKSMNEWASKQPWVCSIGFWCSNRDALKGKKNGNTRSGRAPQGIRPNFRLPPTSPSAGSARFGMNYKIAQRAAALSPSLTLAIDARFGWGISFSLLAIGPVIGVAQMLRLKRDRALAV